MFFGKVIGGLIGLFTGGIIGAIIGIFIGGFFDRGLQQIRLSESPEVLQKVQETFFETTFILIGYLSKADGRVSQEEIDQTQNLMEQMGLKADHKREAIRLFKIGSAPDFDPADTLAKFNEICGQRRQLQQTLMMYLFNTALADGRFDENEESALRKIAAGLNISSFVFERLLQMVKAQSSFGGNGYQQGSSSGYHNSQATSANELATAYAALGVTPETSDRDIKKAYRKLMSENHPDKLMGRGVPEDMIKVATERSQKVQAAYDLIKKHRKK